MIPVSLYGRQPRWLLACKLQLHRASLYYFVLSFRPVMVWVPPGSSSTRNWPINWPSCRSKWVYSPYLISFPIARGHIIRLVNNVVSCYNVGEEYIEPL